MRLAVYFLTVLLLLPLPGCGTIEVSKSSIPLGLGIDFQENQVVLSTQLANPVPPEKTGGEAPRFTVVKAKGSTIVEAARHTTLSSSQVPLWSQAAVYLISEDFASHDLSLFADSTARNRMVRKNIPVVITHNATPEEVFNVKPVIELYTATAIRDLLHTQETQLGIYTPTTIMELLDKLASPGIEPVIPMITIDRSGSREAIKLDGMAVIKGQKMIGTLNEVQSRGFRYLRPKMIQGGLFLIPSPTDPSGCVTIELSRSQAKIEPQFKDNLITMKIKIKAEGNFYEQTGTGDLFTLEMFEYLSALASQQIAADIGMCIDQAQALNSDFLGWGQLIKARRPDLWAELEGNWDQFFPSIPSDIEIDFKIRRSYLTDKSFTFRD